MKSKLRQYVERSANISVTNWNILAEGTQTRLPATRYLAYEYEDRTLWIRLRLLIAVLKLCFLQQNSHQPKQSYNESSESQMPRSGTRVALNFLHGCCRSRHGI